MKHKIKFMLSTILGFAFIGGIISQTVSFNNISHARVLIPTFNEKNEQNPVIPLAEFMWVKNYLEDEKNLQKIVNLTGFSGKLNELIPLRLGGLGRLQIKGGSGGSIVDISVVGKSREFLIAVADATSSVILQEYHQKNSELLGRINLRKQIAQSAISRIESEEKEIIDFIKNKSAALSENSILNIAIMEKTLSAFTIDKTFYLRSLELAEKEDVLIRNNQPMSLGAAYIEPSFILSKIGIIILSSVCGALFASIIILINFGINENK